MEQILEQDIIFNERPITLKNEKYDKTSKKLRVEKVNLENEKVTIQEHVDIDLSDIDMMGLMV